MLAAFSPLLHNITFIAAGSFRVAAKPMLCSVAHCSASQSVGLALCSTTGVAYHCGARQAWRSSAKRDVRNTFLRGPQRLRLSAVDRLRPGSLGINSLATHGNSRHPAETLKTSLGLRRGQHSVTTMQALLAAAAQREDIKQQRAHQRPEAAHEATLPNADIAHQPFLTPNSEQLERAQVDYSRGQRPLQVVDPEVEMIDPADWDVVCDVRTPDEFAEDRMLGAINTPVLSNEQRAQVGTLYKQVGQHEAKRLGAALISRNIADILLENFQEHGKQLRVLVYCWRGGERSQSLAHVLSRVGWEVAIVKRGYMGYRVQVRRCMEVLGRFQYHVIGGATGSGKGKLLDCLRDQGGQVVDLEVAADHRGSILGDHPTRLQPPQKMFESKLLHQMRNFSVDRPVFIESESSLVGRRQVPAAMWKAMQTAAQVTELEVPLGSRVAWLRKNYSYFEDEHKDKLMGKLEALTKTSGKKVVTKWRELAEQSRWDDFVAAMLQEHYDVVYARAQLKYLTPASSEQSNDQAANGLGQDVSPVCPEQSPRLSQEQNGSSSLQHADGDAGQVASPSLANGSSTIEQHSVSDSCEETVEAAGALSHLFGGPRQNLMQQMNSKQAESTLRWHREPVDDISNEIYTTLALKLLNQYDPSALSQDAQPR